MVDRKIWNSKSLPREHDQNKNMFVICVYSLNSHINVDFLRIRKSGVCQHFINRHLFSTHTYGQRDDAKKHLQYNRKRRDWKIVGKRLFPVEFCLSFFFLNLQHTRPLFRYIQTPSAFMLLYVQLNKTRTFICRIVWKDISNKLTFRNRASVQESGQFLPRWDQRIRTVSLYPTNNTAYKQRATRYLAIRNRQETPA